MMWPRRNTLVCILLVVLMCAYVASHYWCPIESLEIAQTDMSTCTESVLLERRPLVITDRLANPDDLLKRSCFRLLYVGVTAPHAILTHNPVTTTARFTILYQTHVDSTRVQILHPRSGQGVEVVLHRHQSLVIPPQWMFACPEGAYMREAHDTVSFMLRLLGLTQPPSSQASTPVSTPTTLGNGH